MADALSNQIADEFALIAEFTGMARNRCHPRRGRGGSRSLFRLDAVEPGRALGLHHTRERHSQRAGLRGLLSAIGVHPTDLTLDPPHRRRKRLPRDSPSLSAKWCAGDTAGDGARGWCEESVGGSLNDGADNSWRKSKGERGPIPWGSPVIKRTTLPDGLAWPARITKIK